MDGGRPQPLFQRRVEVWRGLKDKALGRAHHAVDHGSLEQLAGLADEMPAKPAEPCAVM